MNYFDQSLSSVHEKLASKAISATDLVKQTLDNIKNVDSKINAFITVDEDGALKKAKQIDEKGIDSNNLLSGMPIAIKDNMVTKGLKTTAASKILENFKPIYDATAVKKLNDLGSINVGKTNMDEFAMGGSTENSAFQTTHNPWDETKVPGGSSGGSAAAVAAGEVLAALGSDTGGSIRQPASFNGVVGMKPTYGRVSRWGLIAFGSSLDQIGPITRNVFDNATVLNAIAGHDDHDLTSSDKVIPDFTSTLNKGVKGLKIGIPSEFMAQGLDDDVKQVVLDTAETFKKLGATVEEVSLPHTQYGVAAYYIISSSEASSNLQRFDGIRYGYRAKDAKSLEDVYVKSRSEGFGDEVKRRIMLGTFSLSAGFYDAYFKKAAQVRTLMINDFTKIFKDFDLILAPTAPTPAYGIGEDISDPMTMYMNDVLTLPVNLAGLPGMSIPAGFSKGLPVGVQLIGRPYDELTVYQAGSAFEQDTDFNKQTPKMGGNN
ncbi:MAG: Asp-tRNA(Asn)/Glu-tRNA(Gln) amidotransferase subunit GatA [Lentilactobacillus diolivorans]|jgi:aspartyl-tRNA(Asn)/glutamyl-tRNA(Gln) amidotransferase subunit A|uniref:Glutamyl-tRNA(Gln) amidotransferase subunit A n=2 Tax=Lentilactobacillus diolivorans TaxID=179838 RepID=A0A0R1S0G4_9LACO|nr:Asp-tRNA(Asn)/Glu-tRNA(Gln) amidotransferase subunit GatA [Lentilactobacillus diolivorans]RRG01584.1 MAG: Asp-tRNA(Asn)/Glu-tRNA(Gln) amidotransferase subunit GatA [Lactobacillus sp.]KRL62640.1 glutamyl-tRNA(Gln) amidotransferase subunit A [Lentilactobacillus diolivorans DSM 14421]MCH4164139.1 Asp-tRNA(Asn)/Glu-tRNA(Gln) amidotransferase subunit GatA [Lentilactobacillus diolivorans]MDH5104719.1 Asp-tRNA(Asn)/Glu-tRNA(Gln) amidotransferase subunit GatA [Lentilactobacillus diolivorans]GEP2381